jgi:hypothetical protein
MSAAPAMMLADERGEEGQAARRREVDEPGAGPPLPQQEQQERATAGGDRDRAPGRQTEASGSGLYRPTTSRPSAAASSSPPVTSTLGRGPGRVTAGTATRTSSIASSASGTLIQKIPRQPMRPAMKAP